MSLVKWFDIAVSSFAIGAAVFNIVMGEWVIGLLLVNLAYSVLILRIVSDVLKGEKD